MFRRVLVFTDLSGERSGPGDWYGPFLVPGGETRFEVLPRRRSERGRAVELALRHGADLVLVVAKVRRSAWGVASRMPVPAWVLSPPQDHPPPRHGIRRVVAPVDGCEAVERVVRAAGSLPASPDLETILLHRVERVPCFMPPAAPGYLPQMVFFSGDPDSGLAHRVEELQRGDPRLRLILFEGALVPGILERARNLRPDAILVPVERREWWRRLPFGSIARCVVLACELPVLLLPSAGARKRDAGQGAQDLSPPEKFGAP
ncbi:MAG: universal stress protein [Planctomycetes bacterium]|nr:universal stress protein [Planctomycetota bacterium]